MPKIADRDRAVITCVHFVLNAEEIMHFGKKTKLHSRGKIFVPRRNLLKLAFSLTFKRLFY